jgi:ribosomal protection tetracycline resistance protein
MAIQDGLQRGGSVLLEPIYEFVFIMQPECAGRVMSDVQLMRGEVVDTASDEELIALTALVPVSQSMDYPSTFASITGGKGSVSARLHSYRECAFEPGMDCARRGVDPLDTAKYILAARSALEGNIFDA